MLRITRQPGGEPAILKLEGKLVGPWVEEFRATCPAGGVRLDLSAVTYADAAGVRLLRDLLCDGPTLVSCSALIAELLRAEER